MSVQDEFINKLIDDENEVSVYVDGLRQRGVIIEHDKDVILLQGSESMQIIYKCKASTVCLYDGG